MSIGRISISFFIDCILIKVHAVLILSSWSLKIVHFFYFYRRIWGFIVFINVWMRLWKDYASFLLLILLLFTVFHDGNLLTKRSRLLNFLLNTFFLYYLILKSVFWIFISMLTLTILQFITFHFCWRSFWFNYI